ncbi:MAG: isochorismate synthase [Planctomycetota bacterium]
MDTSLNFELTSPALKRLMAELESLDIAQTQFPLAITVPASEIEPWSLLNANPNLPRVCWSERDSVSSIFGLGSAASVEMEAGGDAADCFAQCQQLLNGNTQLRCYGGFSFDGSAHWKTFGAGLFVIPRIVLSENKLTLAVMDAEDIERCRQELTQLNIDSQPLNSRLPTPVEKIYQPTFDGWQSRIDEALSLIRAEALEKIVLSRKAKLRFAEALDPIALTARLSVSTHDCFVFCFDFGDESAFVGATPERLFFREGNRLYSEVVAGTRVRGENSEADELLAKELLNSDKDQREHDIVRKSIRQKLHKFVEHLEVDSQASILRLAKKQHLRSNVCGTLKDGVDDGMLLNRLHPTPAVGGYPTDNALPEIARIEPFSRGWYAAPVGWIGGEDSQFAVAIRSGLVSGRTLTLYSGAGIVRGSDPDEEWQEIENKIQDYMDVLGH